MKKLLMILILLGLMIININADNMMIRDDANLFDESEEATLNDKISKLNDQYQMDFVIYTTEEYYNGDIKYAAADYYDYNGYRAEGVLLYINMANREYYVLTTGENTIYKLTDYALEIMSDEIANYLSNGNYYGAADHYLDSVVDYLEFYEKTNTTYDINHNMTQSEKINQSLMISAIVALIITAGAIILMISQLKSIKPQRNASTYSANKNNFLKADITKSRDIYLYRTIRREKIQRESHDSGGGSSTFSGSSGISHGGTGGRF